MSDRISYNTANQLYFDKSWITQNYDSYVSSVEKFQSDYPSNKWTHWVEVENNSETYRCELIDSQFLNS